MTLRVVLMLCVPRNGKRQLGRTKHCKAPNVKTAAVTWCKKCCPLVMIFARKHGVGPRISDFSDGLTVGINHDLVYYPISPMTIGTTSKEKSKT